MRSDCVPISRVPGPTQLYRDFVSHFPKVQQFYGNAPGDLMWRRYGSNRRDYPAERRRAVADILERQNRRWDASPAALANIDRLRQGAAAVVTGQQVALFGGPLYSLLKAVTAIKQAKEASAAGYEHVPIFWMATEDHDFAEIRHVAIPANFNELVDLTCEVERASDAPVGRLIFDARIESALTRVGELLGDSEIGEILHESYASGSTLADAFARLFVRLFSQHGLILIDPADPELHAIGSPVLQQALLRHERLAHALHGRDMELEAAGYHAQVNEVENATLLFFIDKERRSAIRTSRNGDGFHVGARQCTLADLERELEANPQQFSPNVLLRPVFQDYLLPTSAYVGGPAEIAYFAQGDVVYRELLGSTTPVLPRLSATIVEPRMQHWLERYGLALADIFVPPSELEQRLGAQAMPVELKQKLSSLGHALHRELQQAEQLMGKIDPTLARAAEKSGSKMRYQMNRLRRLAASAELRKNADLKRHANALSTSLYPKGELQERQVAGAYFLGRYGTQLIQQLLDTVKTACTDHQVLYL